MEDVLRWIDRCERLGFQLGVWHEWKLRPDGRRSGQIVEHLWIGDPEHPGRRPPDSVLLPLMGRARVVRGYLRRIRSPFFPDRPAESDRRRALACSMADDERLREMGR